MPFTIIRQDITKASADALVVSANPLPKIGGSTDETVYEAAGREELLKEREKIGSLEEGEAKATPAFALSAKYLIHVSAPRWADGRQNEGERLRICYRNVLKLAEELKCESIVFPLLSAGAYRFPADLALGIARDEIRSFLEHSDMDVYLAVFDKEAFRLSEQLEKNIASYIDDHYVQEHAPRRREQRKEAANHFSSIFPSAKNTAKYEETSAYFDHSMAAAEEAKDFMAAPPAGILPKAAKEKPAPKRKLEDVIRMKKETFTEMLLRLIDERGLKDSEVYKRANIDRKLFSKIRSDTDYHPKKRTVLSLIMALHLSEDEAKDLLARSGYALSPSSVSDLIISYCLSERIYDIFKVNDILMHFDQPALNEL